MKGREKKENKTGAKNGKNLGRKVESEEGWTNGRREGWMDER